jgi:hypothetical protein
MAKQMAEDAVVGRLETLDGGLIVIATRDCPTCTLIQARLSTDRRP